MPNHSSRILALAAVASAAVLAPVPTQAFTLSVDPGSTTRVFDNFNDGVDTATGFNNSSSLGEAGGFSSISIPEGATDPWVQYPTPGAPFDVATHPFFRIGARKSGGTGDGIFPWPPQGATRIGYNAGTAFGEQQFGFVVAGAGVNGQGFRIDPVGGGLPAGQGAVTFDLDYLMLDRFPTIGLGEFDADGNYDGWTVAGNGFITGDSVSATTSALTGTTAGVDPIIQRGGLGGLGIDLGVYNTLEVRAAFDPASNSRFEIFWGSDAHPGPAGGQSLVVVDQLIRDGAYHTYRFNLTDEANWAGNLAILRLDPLADADAAAGRSFGIDYVRLIAGPIPEPSTAALVALAAAFGLGRRRRRR